MKFREDIETACSEDLYYDLFNGGYIDPFEMLENAEEAAAVCDAVALINKFLYEAEESGVLEVV